MILMYHKIYLESPTIWWVDVDNFYRQMCELKCKKVVYLDEYDFKNSEHVVITFDGVYKNVLQFAAPILEKFGYPFELFVIGDYVGKNNSFDTVEPLTDFADFEDLKELVRLGGRLQWHTRKHPNLNEIVDKRQLVKEIITPQKFNSFDKKGFKWFGYPHGDVNETLIELTKKYYNGAVSCVQGNDGDLYKLNRITAENHSSFKKASIGVIIPSYNYGSFLIEAVESVLRQTRPADEILISDDASTDNTEEIARFYQLKYPNLIKYNRNKNNLGIVKHFNKAVSLTMSDYVCFLGADNRFRSDYIEKTAAILDSDDQIGIAYTDYALFGSRAGVMYDLIPGNRKGGVVENTYYLVNFPDFTPEAVKNLKKANFMHGSSMYRRKVFDKVGGYREGSYEDHSLFYRMVKKGWKAKRTPFPLLEYRQHSQEQTNAKLQSLEELNFYKSQYKELKKEQEELKKEQEELVRIKSSKFWKLLFIYKNPKQGLKMYGPRVLPLLKRKIISRILNIV